MARVAINGFGRIGRNAFKIGLEKGLDIIAINDLTDAQTLAHLLRYDSCFGKYAGTVEVRGKDLVVNGRLIQVVAERDPSRLPWKELNVDIVIESTGLFASAEKAQAHLNAGAKRVIISCPAKGTKSFVMGVNHLTFDPATDYIVDNASCTTNCLAPVAKVLQERFGIVRGMMTTVHSYTNDQVLTDVYHRDPRRARAAGLNIIPTRTGAAAAVGLVLPELNGKLDGFAIRVPTINVSVVDLTFNASRKTSVEEVNEVVKKASEGKLKGILAYNVEPLVSSDFNHNPASSIFDATQTRVVDGSLVKILSWYDNEWGFSCRMLDTTVALWNAK